jgi:hypothetical protein
MANAQNVSIMHSASGTLSYSAGALVGYSVREIAGAPAVFRLRDGSETGDPRNILQTVSLAARESARESFQPAGIGYDYGLYIEVVSGQIEGSAQVIAGAR